MAKIVVVTSGKGGVGKTTTSASFASGLALAGHKTAVIDFDVGLRNLDLIMGCERRVVYDLINVIQGEANLNQALIKDKQCDNLFVLAASQTRDKDALSQEDIKEILRIELIGVVPESETVLDASNQGVPAVHLKGTDVSEAYKDVVARFLGETRTMRFTDAPKPGFFKRVFGGR